MTSSTADKDLVIKHVPESQNSFLRWQVGVIVARPMEEPVYGDDGRIEDFRLTTAMCNIFHVLGFGDTKAKAYARALAAL